MRASGEWSVDSGQKSDVHRSSIVVQRLLQWLLRAFGRRERPAQGDPAVFGYDLRPGEFPKSLPGATQCEAAGVALWRENGLGGGVFIVAIAGFSAAKEPPRQGFGHERA